MILAIALALQIDTVAKLHQPDTAPLNDPMRPVSQITRESFTLQYFTEAPCATKVEIRQDDVPMTAFGRKSPVAWQVIERSGMTTTHRISATALKPGARYYYRVWDPGAKPTSEEKNWGASEGYRREFAVSTQAAKGRKTVIHLPVKVLLMPNVINVLSAYGERTNPAPEPPKLTPAELQKIKDEYAVSSRYFWVNSGMRLWVDYQFFVDDRWQRWGVEPEGAVGVYKGLPLCRSYSGQDYAQPGGGTFTILDTKDINRVTNDPVIEERPYSGQIEQAFVRKWNPNAKKWEFYNSGGGTYGVDGFPQGVPGRSQFLGGGDTAWLATHEFHHDMESHGQFSLSNREDDRIAFNHYNPRHRTLSGNGNVDEMTWSSSGRHGEHWDGMAFWDRVLSDAQWLRLYFGYTETVKDADGDGVPDDDPRLPLDEKRFGSNPARASTDGLMGDLPKAMLSNWAPSPLQASWIKTGYQGVVPDPKKLDNDGDGVPDDQDSYPLYPYEPFIVAHRATIDGDPFEWRDVPVGGKVVSGTGVGLTFKQSHDEAGYYGLFEVKGPWKRIDTMLDGEGLGVYSGVEMDSLQVLNLAATSGPGAGPLVGVVDVKITPFKAPGLKWKATRQGDTTYFEFSLPNRGEGNWYWTRGGREVGAQINVWDDQNRGFSVGEPYHVYYARMIEPVGQVPLPRNPPTDIGTQGTAYLPGDPKIRFDGDWKKEGDALVYYGGDPEGSVIVEIPKLGNFDLLAVIEGGSDGVIGAFGPGQKINAGTGYVGFVGGYNNRATRMRLNGQEVGDEPIGMTPGKHRLQLTRRDGEVWLIVDGKPLIYGPDPTPQMVLSRVAVIGGYGGRQKVYEIRVRQ